MYSAHSVRRLGPRLDKVYLHMPILTFSYSCFILIYSRNPTRRWQPGLICYEMISENPGEIYFQHSFDNVDTFLFGQTLKNSPWQQSVPATYQNVSLRTMISNQNMMSLSKFTQRKTLLRNNRAGGRRAQETAA